MKKLLLTSFLAILMVSTTYSAPIRIGTSDTYWEVTGTTLHITGTGDMPDFTYSTPAPWYSARINIEFLTIDDAITRIGNYEFYDFSKITTLTLPASLVSIGSSAFDGCSGLTGNIHFPAGFTSLNNIGAFELCSGITSFTVDTGNSVYSAEDGVLFNKTKTILYRCPEGKSGSYTPPATLTNVGTMAFIYCQKLTSVTLQEGVMSIVNNAFNSCRGLETVYLPASLTTIGSSVFSDCTALSEINVLNPVPADIQPNVFEGVNKINCTLNVPEEAVFAYRAAPVWQDFFLEAGNTYMINVSVNNLAAGTVTGGNILYNEGEDVILIAFAKSGYTFVNWTENGNVVHTGSTYTFTAASDRELVANFAGQPTMLATLTVSEGTLTPAFIPNITEYTVSVANSIFAIAINATAMNPNATITGAGEKLLTVGENVFIITVTSEDGAETKDYTVTVTRSANVNLATLTVSTGTLSPAFNANVTTYTVTVPNEITDLTINATAQDANATVTGTGEKTLNVGSNVFTITVTAEDGAETKNYTIAVTREEFVSISQTEANEIKVYNTAGGIAVKNVPAGETINVYSIMGVLVASTQNTEIELAQKGVYIVKVGNFTTKIVKY